MRTGSCAFGFFAGSAAGNSASTSFTLASLGRWTRKPRLVEEGRSDSCYGDWYGCNEAQKQSPPAFSGGICAALEDDEEFLSPPASRRAT